MSDVANSTLHTVNKKKNNSLTTKMRSLLAQPLSKQKYIKRTENVSFSN